MLYFESNFVKYNNENMQSHLNLLYNIRMEQVVANYNK